MGGHLKRLTTVVSAEDPVQKILIAKSLAERLERRVAGSEYKSVSDYAISVLRQIIEQLDAEK